MSNSTPSYEEQVERNERLHHLAERDARRDLCRTCLQIVLWMLCGLVLIGLAFHSGNLETGQLLYFAGRVVWVGGLSFTLLAYYQRHVRRQGR